MPIPTSCPACKTPYKIPDNLAGKKVRCAKCQQAFDVPALPPPPPPEEELVSVELVEPSTAAAVAPESQEIQREPRRLPPRPPTAPLGPPRPKKTPRRAPRPSSSSP